MHNKSPPHLMYRYFTLRIKQSPCRPTPIAKRKVTTVNWQLQLNQTDLAIGVRLIVRLINDTIETS